MPPEGYGEKPQEIQPNILTGVIIEQSPNFIGIELNGTPLCFVSKN